MRPASVIAETVDLNSISGWVEPKLLITISLTFSIERNRLKPTRCVVARWAKGSLAIKETFRVTT